MPDSKNSKISELTELTAPVGSDIIPIVDSSDSETKKITYENLISGQTAGIATNTANIATNTANIATNTANIASNDTDIASNTAAIAAKIPNDSTTGTPSASTFLRGDNAWASLAGGGDMLSSVYDPSNKDASAFSMGNMDETTTAKILTATERSQIAANNAKVGITPTQAADITANNAKVGITTAQAADIVTNNAKVTNANHSGDVTGDTVLTIADDAVDIPMLSATGTPDGTTFLRGDNAWATPAGGGTVTSVAVSGSDGVEVDSGSPITGAGTIALGLNKTTTLSTLNVEDGADVTDETNVVAALSGATLTDAGTPAGTDKVLIQDTSDSDNLKYVDVNDLPSGGGGSGLTSAEVFKQSIQTMAILPPEFTYTNDGTYGFASKTNDVQNLVSLTCNTGAGAYAIATREPRSTGSTLGIWNRPLTDSGADFSKTIRIGGRMLLRFGGSNANWGVDDVVRIKFGDIGEKLAGDLAESRLNFDAKTGDFTVGLVVTGGTSGATGTITSVGVSGTTGSLGLSGVSGTFSNNEQLTDTSTGVADVNGSITNDQAVCVMLKKPTTGDYPDVYLQHASGGTVTTSAKITQSTFYRTNASSYYFELVINNGNLSFSVNGTQIGATVTGVYTGNTADSDLQFENDRTAGTGASSSYVSFADIKFYGETY